MVSDLPRVHKALGSIPSNGTNKRLKTEDPKGQWPRHWPHPAISRPSGGQEGHRLSRKAQQTDGKNVPQTLKDKCGDSVKKITQEPGERERAACS